MNILKAVKGIFGFDGVGDTALKIVEKISGTDFTSKEKAEFILKHAEVTKYQSPTRRLIAWIMIIQWSVMVNVWLISTIVGRALDIPASVELAADVTAFMNGNINVGVTAIMGFYFLMGMKK